jgi:uncharacterized membrane protein YhaH (DUF805 family)
MWKCPKCGEQMGDAIEACWKCGVMKNRATATRSSGPPLSVCSHCGNRVAPTLGNICPSCRRPFVEETPRQEAAFGTRKKTVRPRDVKNEDVNWYVEALRKYAVFDGRSQRKEYWTFTLVNTIVGLMLPFIDGFAGGTGLITIAFGLFMFMPSLAVTIRRLHDTDRSGWWLLVSFVPILGPIVLIALMLEACDPGDNRYGPGLSARRRRKKKLDLGPLERLTSGSTAGLTQCPHCGEEVAHSAPACHHCGKFLDWILEETE